MASVSTTRTTSADTARRPCAVSYGETATRHCYPPGTSPSSPARTQSPAAGSSRPTSAASVPPPSFASTTSRSTAALVARRLLGGGGHPPHGPCGGGGHAGPGDQTTGGVGVEVAGGVIGGVLPSWP